MLGDKKWLIGPVIIGLILLSSLVSVSLLIYRANTDPNFAVEPDYYERGLNWDETAAQRAVNDELGWTVTIGEASVEGEPGRRFVSMTLTITDGSGEPVEGAMVDFEAFHNARAKAKQRESGVAGPFGEPGAYRVSFPGELAGWHQLRLRVQAGEDIFTYSDEVNVEPLSATTTNQDARGETEG